MDINLLSQFHKFPLLPSELRLKIWHVALTVPRTVDINLKRSVRPSTGQRSAQSFNTTTPIPALLHTCRESRLEGLTIYKPLFTTRQSENFIYISLTSDVIQVPANVISYFGKDECREIRSLTVHVKDLGYFGYYNMDTLMTMSALKELTLLVESVVGTLWDVERWVKNGYHYLEPLMKDFREASIANPTWERPTVHIMDAKTGEELVVLEGGVYVPEDGEERPIVVPDADVDIIIPPVH
ncbi:hypothetical protein F5884DRAFT_455405 [Xylogone sp. PMI_703]|nr:hypothetical protein F5884DRAFT_455405 [Xylogone sp. PMI_703]